MVDVVKTVVKLTQYYLEERLRTLEASFLEYKTDFEVEASEYWKGNLNDIYCHIRAIAYPKNRKERKTYHHLHSAHFVSVVRDFHDISDVVQKECSEIRQTLFTLRSYVSYCFWDMVFARVFMVIDNTAHANIARHYGKELTPDQKMTLGQSLTTLSNVRHNTLQDTLPYTSQNSQNTSVVAKTSVWSQCSLL